MRVDCLGGIGKPNFDEIFAVTSGSSAQDAASGPASSEHQLNLSAPCFKYVMCAIAITRLL
jgi:hypothetical protein